jgi:hypothetical protein
VINDDDLRTARSVIHNKSGGSYEVIGTGRIQTDKPLTDMSDVVIYFSPESGYVGEIIIVNLDCIESVTEVGSVPDRRYSLKHDPHKSINIEY